MSMSDYLENALINAVLRNVAFTSPATVYVSLHTADPTDAGTGAEVATGGYARQAIAFNAPSNGTTTNSAQITFPTATADWGVITHFGIWSAGSGGNLLFAGILNTSKTVLTGDVFKFNAGGVTVTLD